MRTNWLFHCPALTSLKTVLGTMVRSSGLTFPWNCGKRKLSIAFEGAITIFLLDHLYTAFLGIIYTYFSFILQRILILLDRYIQLVVLLCLMNSPCLNKVTYSPTDSDWFVALLALVVIGQSNFSV